MSKNNEIEQLITIGKEAPNVDDRDLSTFSYQKDLTKKLDAYIDDFDQSIINEIVLWKVNRYALFSKNTLDLLNKIDPKAKGLRPSEIKQTVIALLKTDGVRLPMASSILRFKNPHIFQIIDQRVYRYINGKTAKYPTNEIDAADFYFSYLQDLRKVCDEHGLCFEDADRVLYVADKRVNKDVRLKY